MRLPPRGCPARLPREIALRAQIATAACGRKLSAHITGADCEPILPVQTAIADCERRLPAREFQIQASKSKLARRFWTMAPSGGIERTCSNSDSEALALKPDLRCRIGALIPYWYVDKPSGPRVRNQGFGSKPGAYVDPRAPSGDGYPLCSFLNFAPHFAALGFSWRRPQTRISHALATDSDKPKPQKTSAEVWLIIQNWRLGIGTDSGPTHCFPMFQH